MTCSGLFSISDTKLFYCRKFPSKESANEEISRGMEELTGFAMFMGVEGRISTLSDLTAIPFNIRAGAHH
jgi:hypothetical protein